MNDSSSPNSNKLFIPISKMFLKNIFIASILKFKCNILSLEPKSRKVEFQGNISFLTYGGCSLMVECGPVAPKTRVRFPPTAFIKGGRGL